MIGKRGQFFILAAVILSVIVIGLVSIGNNVQTKKEPLKFYDLSYELDREAAKIIDYGVLNDLDDAAINLLMADFTNAVQKNLRDRDPELDFIFIYGNDNELVVENYGREPTRFEINEVGSNNKVKTLDGANGNVVSTVGFNFGNTNFDVGVVESNDVYKKSWREVVSENQLAQGRNGARVTLKLAGKDYDFEVGKKQRFFMLLKKVDGGDEYVDFR